MLGIVPRPLGIPGEAPCQINNRRTGKTDRRGGVPELRELLSSSLGVALAAQHLQAEQVLQSRASRKLSGLAVPPAVVALRVIKLKH